MENLVVNPEHLKGLATTQEVAATKEGAAATAASGIETAVWVTHGVVCGASNVAFTKAEAARRSAGDAMKKTSTNLAEKLRVASTAYESTDQQTGGQIDKQVLDR